MGLLRVYGLPRTGSDQNLSCLCTTISVFHNELSSFSIIKSITL